MNQVYQLVIAYGEWEWYSEEVIFVDVDIDRVRSVRDELKAKATAALVQAMAMNPSAGDDIYGWVALAMEDGVDVRLEAVTLGVLDRDNAIAEVIEREIWNMPQFTNMEDEPWEGDDLELHRYENMAEPWEQRFLS